MERLTPGNFHLRDGLPFVHCYKPSAISPTTAEVDDELVPVIS
jgi:hypothetical protein